MDEEDVAWLNIINEKRTAEGLNKIHEDQFELLMDRLEKESYFHVQTNGSKDYSAPIDEDAICCVCMDGECSNTNVILFCDLCNLAVHQECYGVPYIPEGQWLCRRCLQSPSRSVECCLCPNRGGAFKQTDDGRWAHVVCGLWIPEVRFANTVFLEPIDSIDNIPPARWKLSCRVCKQRGVGACIQCHKTNCYTAFHVTCGLLAGLHMKMDTVREPSAAGSLSVTVRKTAYCDVHTPLDSDCKPKLDDVAALGINTPKQKALKGNEKPNKKGSRENGSGNFSDGPGAAAPVVPVLFRGLMNFSPQCPWDKVQEIASLINVQTEPNVQRKNQFFQRLMAYWTLKRQTRNGVPLIRRLQFAKATRPEQKPETPQKNAHHNRKKKEREKEVAEKAKAELSGMMDERRSLRRLRQDLERVRLLCELIRKREQRKRDKINVQAQICELECFPLIFFLRKVMNLLTEIDQQQIFSDPVDLEEVPDYLDHIRNPMDIKTMNEKLESFAYLTLDDLEQDFNLMVDNCLSYNERDTMFFRAGVKMRDHGGTIIRQARREIESVGFDLKTGLHTEERLSQKEELSDDKLMKEIDSFMGGGDTSVANIKEMGVPTAEERGMSHNDYLSRLLELQDKANLLHHPVAKVKRLKLLKQEITKVRRKLSMDRTGTSPGHKGHKLKSAIGLTENGELLDSESLGVSNKKGSIEEVSSPGNARRLRAGKEIEIPPGISRPANSLYQGKKRRNISGSDSSDGEQSNKKMLAECSSTEDGMLKASGSSLTSSPAKSPAGVNRRNAILFTRKKQLASASSNQNATNGASNSTTSQEDLCSSKVEGNAKQLKESNSNGKKKNSDQNVDNDLKVNDTPEPSILENMETEIRSPVKNTSKEKEKNDDIKKPILSVGKMEPPKIAGTKKGIANQTKSISIVPTPQTSAIVGGPSITNKSSISSSNQDFSSFKTYRRGGEIGETDDETQSGSATDIIGTSEEKILREDPESTSSPEQQKKSSTSPITSIDSYNLKNIHLEPLDIVWAKTYGFPWYPALMIDNQFPPQQFLDNGVPIPVPSKRILDMAKEHLNLRCLINFFDTQRSWQWVSRDKLEPLGVDYGLDQGKLVQSKKPSERKAVKKAYEEAILHRCKVTGEIGSLESLNLKNGDDCVKNINSISGKGDSNVNSKRNSRNSNPPLYVD